MKRRMTFKIILALGDVLILSGGFLLAYYFRFSLTILPQQSSPPLEIYFRFSYFVGLVGFLMLNAFGMYRLQHPSFKVDDFFSILRAVTFNSLIIMALSFALKGIITRYDVETYSRLVVAMAWLLSLIALTLWRWGFSICFGHLLRQGIGLRRIVIIGTDEVAHGFHRAIVKNVACGYLSLGFLSFSSHLKETGGRGNGGHKPPVFPKDRADRVEESQILGRIDDLPSLLQTERVDEVVLATMNLDTDVIASTIQTCERTGVQFSIIPSFFEILTHQMCVKEVADIPIFQLKKRILQQWSRLVKRSLDIVLSACVVTLTAPVWIFVGIGIRLESKGPVLFRQARIGKGEKVFYTYKMRSMYDDAEQKRHEIGTQNIFDDSLFRGKKNDPRVTRIGRFMRRFSLDEFPQVINVFKGEMSWVGPRPHTPDEVKGYKKWHLRRYDVLPGITGLTQVSGRRNLSLDEMARLDIYYIENWSPVLDLQILLKTIPIVLKGSDNW